MNNLTAQLLPQVVKIINEYGITVDIFRNTYANDVFGVSRLETTEMITSIKVVIDNAQDSRTANNRFKVEGMIRPQNVATIYYAFDENVNLKREDYFIIDGIKYILDVPRNILHYNILYQVNAEVTIE
jgi:hypothetical protein